MVAHENLHILGFVFAHENLHIFWGLCFHFLWGNSQVWKCWTIRCSDFIFWENSTVFQRPLHYWLHTHTETVHEHSQAIFYAEGISLSMHLSFAQNFAVWQRSLNPVFGLIFVAPSWARWEQDVIHAVDRETDAWEDMISSRPYSRCMEGLILKSSA